MQKVGQEIGYLGTVVLEKDYSRGAWVRRASLFVIQLIGAILFFAAILGMVAVFYLAVNV